MVGERPKPLGQVLGFDSIKSTLIVRKYDAGLVDSMMMSLTPRLLQIGLLYAS